VTCAEEMARCCAGDEGDRPGPLHDDVTFAGPLGATEGADAYIEAIRGMTRVATVLDRWRTR
jgi:hypothetical protein